MRTTAVIHEAFMNRSRGAHPRVGGGVGGGVGGRGGLGFGVLLQDQSAYLTFGARDWTWR